MAEAVTEDVRRQAGDRSAVAPAPRQAMRHGGQLLVDQLAVHGATRAFCIPGESFLAALDGFVDSTVELVVCRQEGGAAMMAEAHGKLTGAPGIAFVTRGPGATNAASGVHVAFQDSTPMILFIGQVARDQRDREAFQEVDFRAMYGPLAKWVAEIDLTDRIPEYVSRAFHIASSGRPGPVVLSLPEDMLSAPSHAQDALPAAPALNGLDDEGVDAILDVLRAAERPLCLVGGSAWSRTAADDLARFASNWSLPVATSFRCQDYLDNRLPTYVGDAGVGKNEALAKRIADADVLLVLGARIGEMTSSGYTLLNIPEPQQTLIHVYPDGDELGRVYRPTVGVVGQPAAVVARLAAAAGPASPVWRGWARDARDAYEAFAIPQPTPGDLQLATVVRHLCDVLPDDAIITNGAGNYAAWVHRYFTYKGYRTQLAPTSGSMGYGVPAAIAAKLAEPAREVIAFAGDGCFQMTCQEFGTACAESAAIIVLVCDNGIYGTIRMHQERTYPGRVSGTSMTNPDFAAFARAYGGYGETVRSDAEFAPALERARQAGVPAILHLITDPAAISPRTPRAAADRMR